MANSATIGGNVSAAVLGVANPIAFSGTLAFTPNNAPILYQTATTTPAALALGGVATIAALLLKVLTGSGTQHVYLGLDNAYPPANRISDVPEGLGILLINPCASGAVLYISCDTGTIAVQYQLVSKT